MCTVLLFFLYSKDAHSTNISIVHFMNLKGGFVWLWVVRWQHSKKVLGSIVRFSLCLHRFPPGAWSQDSPEKAILNVSRTNLVKQGLNRKE